MPETTPDLTRLAANKGIQIATQWDNWVYNNLDKSSEEALEVLATYI